MDNENKETEFDPSEIELDLGDLEGDLPEIEANQEKSSDGAENTDMSETEFDPTVSEEFYTNLEAALNFDEENLEPSNDEPQEEEPAAENPEEEDDWFEGMNAALNEQIAHEFGGVVEDSPVNQPIKKSIWQMIPKWTKVLVSVVLVLLVTLGLLFGTKGGRSLVYKVIAKIAVGIIPVDPYENIPTPTPDESVDPSVAPDLTPTMVPEPTGDPGVAENPNQNPEPTSGGMQEPTLTPEPTATPIPQIEIKDDKNIINILLIGAENVLHDQVYGKSDAVIVVSVNLKGGDLKMISFMRDLYVEIPWQNYKHKLNHAYTMYGPKGAVEAIEQNFGIDIDGYVKVEFDGFKNIIDELGGVKIELTAAEAKYLTTDPKGIQYIPNPEDRNIVPGVQNMSGSQLLGYCRLRFVDTKNGLSGDMGRNYRHRVALQAIFDKCKDMSKIKLLGIMMDFLGKGYITRSEGFEEIATQCLEAVIENRMFNIKTEQIPIKHPEKGNLYQYLNAPVGKKQTIEDVVYFDPENIELLQEFIYGE